MPKFTISETVTMLFDVEADTAQEAADAYRKNGRPAGGTEFTVGDIEVADEFGHLVTTE